MKTAIFSGRFDPVNLGHVITTHRLLEVYDKVIVVILDYPERTGCSAKDAYAMFHTVFGFGYIDSVIEFCINATHFGKIREFDLKRLLYYCKCDMDNTDYVGGNKEVNKHIESLGVIPVQYIPRTPIYNSTEIRKRIEDGESLEEQYNIEIKKI